MVVRQEAVDACCPAEHNINIGVAIKLILTELERLLNGLVPRLHLSTQPGISINDLGRMVHQFIV